MGYSGERLFNLVKRKYKKIVEVIKRPRKYFWVPAEITNINAYLQAKGIDITSGFKVLPKRWIVERTFAWLDKYRRMHKDYEYLCATSENLILAAMSRTMLKRISKLMKN